MSGESRTVPSMTAPSELLDRLHPFEACFNFRDLGGYRTMDGRVVRQGRVYRADALHRLTERDIAAFRTLKLSTVIDLRSTPEIESYGRVTSDVAETTWHHRPLIDSVQLEPGQRTLPAGEEAPELEPGESYFHFLGDGAVAVSVIELLATAPGPAVFHCTAGKDRTGIIASMVLDLLGVDDEAIAEDYVFTEHTRARSTAWIREHEPTLAAFLDEIPAERREVRAEAILSFLRRVRDAHGSVADFVLAGGLGINELAQLRHRLLAD